MEHDASYTGPHTGHGASPWGLTQHGVSHTELYWGHGASSMNYHTGHGTIYKTWDLTQDMGLHKGHGNSYKRFHTNMGLHTWRSHSRHEASYMGLHTVTSTPNSQQVLVIQPYMFGFSQGTNPEKLKWGHWRSTQQWLDLVWLDD